MAEQSEDDKKMYNIELCVPADFMQGKVSSFQVGDCKRANARADSSS